LRKYRVVVDTNVFVSSFWGGNPEKLVRLFIQGKVALILSPAIIEEVERVLARILGKNPDVADLISLLKLKAIVVSPQKVFSTIKDDPHDNKFLDCAFAGEAQFIVSGDRHLLRLRKFKDVRIVTVKEFLDLP
jgi:putative PIN family toxin of toxin-antitoxin system